MLRTIHVIDGEGSRVLRDRRRPRETSTNSKKVREIFEGSSCKTIPIPTIVDDYNHNMGGVDVADQLRSYYSTQLAVSRTWMPLFFWILDTSIINSYIIGKKLGINQNHKSFRLELIQELIKDSLNNNNTKRTTRSDSDSQSARMEEVLDKSAKKIRVSGSFELPLCRLNGNKHYVEYRETREACL